MTKEDFFDLEAGKTFILGNKRLRVEETKEPLRCKKCFFAHFDCYEFLSVGVIPECLKKHRKDNKNVVFVEVENEN